MVWCCEMSEMDRKPFPRENGKGRGDLPSRPFVDSLEAAIKREDNMGDETKVTANLLNHFCAYTSLDDGVRCREFTKTLREVSEGAGLSCRTTELYRMFLLICHGSLRTKSVPVGDRHERSREETRRFKPERSPERIRRPIAKSPEEGLLIEDPIPTEIE